jgi:hypothetical protein
MKVAQLGAGELLVTSMDGDGTQRGYDLDLTREIADAVRRWAMVASRRARVSMALSIGKVGGDGKALPVPMDRKRSGFHAEIEEARRRSASGEAAFILEHRDKPQLSSLFGCLRQARPPPRLCVSARNPRSAAA